MHRRRRTALVLSAAIAAAAPLLTACGNDAHPGAAAVVGGQRITVAQLENRVNEVRRAQRATVPQAQYQQVLASTSSLTRDTLHNMVLDRVLHRAAQDQGITVSRREVQRMRTGLEQQAGGAKGLETTWLQKYGIAPARLDDNLRLQIEAQKLATRLGTDTTQPAFWKALSTASEELHVDLNPRYGTWDVQKSSRVDAKTPWVREVTASGTQETA